MKESVSVILKETSLAKKECKPVNLNTLAGIKGWFTQRKVLLAIEELIEEKEIKNGGELFPFSEEDFIEKTDFLIYPWFNSVIRLQVESSYHSYVKEICEKRGIYYIVVPPSMGIKAIKKKILAILKKDEEKRKSKR